MMTRTVTSQEDTELATRLRLGVMRLARRLRQQAPEGITPSQLSAIATLEGNGPLTLKDLAAAERVQPPTMTRIVAALEEAGLVVRSVDKKDRRCSNLKLTGDGKRFIARARSRKTAYLAARIGALSDSERTTLAAATEILERFVKERD
jgi:DNA-binding MarR family transcriptional regulator